MPFVIDGRLLASGDKREDYATPEETRSYWFAQYREILGQPPEPEDEATRLRRQNRELRETLATIVGTFTDEVGVLTRSQWVRTDLIESWKRQVWEAG